VESIKWLGLQIWIPISHGMRNEMDFRLKCFPSAYIAFFLARDEKSPLAFMEKGESEEMLICQSTRDREKPLGIRRITGFLCPVPGGCGV
jgi:hypothetical protein